MFELTHDSVVSQVSALILHGRYIRMVEVKASNTGYDWLPDVIMTFSG